MLTGQLEVAHMLPCLAQRPFLAPLFQAPGRLQRADGRLGLRPCLLDSEIGKEAQRDFLGPASAKVIFNVALDGEGFALFAHHDEEALERIARAILPFGCPRQIGDITV